LALALGVFHRKAHAPTVAEALAWSAFWILLALAFNAPVFFLYENNWIGAGLAFPEDASGSQAAVEFFTGYVLEKSLSLDNIFVIALIFSRFAWTTYLLGAVLLITAARMLVMRHDNLEPEYNPLIRLARRFYPVTDDLRDEHFFVRKGGRWTMPPLLLVLLLVETTDLLFAVDSIPAIIAVTEDPFLVYSSNIFAILGLRSLYFALAQLLASFRFLRASLVFVLAFVGVKMLLAHHHHIPVVVSLTVILGILAVGVFASVVYPQAGHRSLALTPREREGTLLQVQSDHRHPMCDSGVGWGAHCGGIGPSGGAGAGSENDPSWAGGAGLQRRWARSLLVRTEEKLRGESRKEGGDNRHRT